MTLTDILNGLLWVIIAVHNLGIAGAILGGAALVIWSIKSGRRAWTLIGVTIALSPFILFVQDQSASRHRLSKRQTEVRNLPRRLLPVNYPRQLLVEGSIAPATVESLMVLGYFDAVEVRQSDFDAVVYSNANQNTECKNSARDWLTRDVIRKYYFDRAASPSRLSRCVTAYRDIPQLAASADAVVLRIDDKAKNRTSGRIWMNGAMELVLRHNGADQLIDYRERPYEERQVALTSPMPEALPEGQELKPDQVLLDALHHLGNPLPRR